MLTLMQHELGLLLTWGALYITQRLKHANPKVARVRLTSHVGSPVHHPTTDVRVHRKRTA